MVRPEDGDRNWYEYTHSLNKNVSHLIDKTGSIVAHYDYDAYGNMIEQTGNLAVKNPIRFSSEYDDEELSLVYYNYRHYNPKDGRWINRDPIAESGGINLYGFIYNKYIINFDYIGLTLKNKKIDVGENGFERIDIEYPHDSDIEHGKGKGNIHVHCKDDKYYWNNDINNKDKCFNFINKNGQKLPKEARKYLMRNKELWKKITENAEKFINEKGGFSPKYGGGSFVSGIFALALLPFELDNINEAVKSLIENSKNGNFGEASEAKAKLINSLPASGGVPTGLQSLMINELDGIEAEIHKLYNNQK